ncbi:MAG: helix-turn-helix domain-containing protein, partial [Oscillospiraceae bacterium]|nr:helix-turn-helix domain-containing protein [Oscillospiraceae bacterium]
MGVIRVEHNANYTTMSNFHLRDSRLSLRAMGLMSKMLSLPDDWDYTVAGLASICKEGRDAVRKALMELEGAGYLVR